MLKCAGGRTPGCVTCLKAAGCDTAAFGSGSCTGFDAPSVSISSSDSKCTDADKKTWDADAGHATWQQQMTSCGTKCLGKASCVSSCMQGDGWSAGCAGCFTPDCVTCLKAAGCDTAAFGSGSCTGFDA